MGNVFSEYLYNEIVYVWYAGVRAYCRAALPSSMFCVARQTSAMVEVFIPWKSANTTLTLLLFPDFPSLSVYPVTSGQFSVEARGLWIDRGNCDLLGKV